MRRRLDDLDDGVLLRIVSKLPLRERGALAGVNSRFAALARSAWGRWFAAPHLDVRLSTFEAYDALEAAPPAELAATTRLTLDGAGLHAMHATANAEGRQDPGWASSVLRVATRRLLERLPNLRVATLDVRTLDLGAWNGDGDGDGDGGDGGAPRPAVCAPCMRVLELRPGPCDRNQTLHACDLRASMPALEELRVFLHQEPDGLWFEDDLFFIDSFPAGLTSLWLSRVGMDPEWYDKVPAALRELTLHDCVIWYDDVFDAFGDQFTRLSTVRSPQIPTNRLPRSLRALHIFNANDTFRYGIGTAEGHEDSDNAVLDLLRLPDLRDLALSFFVGNRDETFDREHLASLTKLTRLVLDAFGDSGEFLDADFPELVDLRLNLQPPRDGQTHAPALPRSAPRLETLMLSVTNYDCELTSKKFALPAYPSLRRLVLREAELDEAAVRRLCGLTQLTRLELLGCALERGGLLVGAFPPGVLSVRGGGGYDEWARVAIDDILDPLVPEGREA